MISDLPELMFLAGVPATGKTYFGEWLRNEYGAIHLDLDREEVRANIPGEWQALVHQRDAKPLARKIQTQGLLAVVGWGYPAYWLWVPKAFADAGFEPWWFHAEVEPARDAFRQRSPAELPNFESQMGAILAQWRLTHDLFSPRIIETLSVDMARLSPDLILRRMAEIRATIRPA